MNFCSNSQIINSQAPQFWWMINNADKYQYTCLKLAIASNCTKNQRNKRIETFSEVMEAIKTFAIRGDQEDKIRCLVCGIAWLPEGIAINTHQLKKLVSKCKSSINGSLQKMGFIVNLGRTEAANAVTNNFTFLKDNNTELRKWSVRKYPSGTNSTNFTSSKIDSPPYVYNSNENNNLELSARDDIKGNQFEKDDLIESNHLDTSTHFEENWDFFLPEFSYNF